MNTWKKSTELENLVDKTLKHDYVKFSEKGNKAARNKS